MVSQDNMDAYLEALGKETDLPSLHLSPAYQSHHSLFSISLPFMLP